jgi:hypothetical protein
MPKLFNVNCYIVLVCSKDQRIELSKLPRVESAKVSESTSNSFSQFYVGLLGFMIPFPMVHSAFHLGCNDPTDFEVGDYSAYCPATKAISGVLSGGATAYFVAYTLYCYTRLYTVLRGTREYNILKAYMLFVVTLYSIFVLSQIAISASGLTNEIDKVDTIYPSRPHLASVLRPVRYASIALAGTTVNFVSIYLFYKMMQIIFKTSSKIAKLKRTDDAEFVTKLHRRFMTYIVISS